MLQPYFQFEELEAGCDEAGRGCYAGPVCAAAVILPKGFSHPLLNDSKQLTYAERAQLRPVIEQSCLAYAVAFICNEEIDRINILQATYKAIHQAVGQLKSKPQLLVIDGNRFNGHGSIPHVCVIKGDGKYQHIAAASILAKTYRDELMEKYHEQYPAYGWKTNKGYGTLTHREAIAAHGLCEYHRKSFRCQPEPLQSVLFSD